MSGYSTTWLRWALLVLALACLAAGLVWLSAPMLSADGDEGTERIVPFLLLPTAYVAALFELDSDSATYKLQLAVLLGVLLLTQWMFLRPRRGWKVRMAATARPMKTAVAAAAFMAMMLSLGAMGVLLELGDLWNEILDHEDWAGPIALALTLLWLLWAMVFYAYWRKGTRLQQLRTVARGLIVGSILELVVAAGVFLWKEDPHDCWCARGSYAGLVFGATVMLWAFGPGLVFLFLREARFHRDP